MIARKIVRELRRWNRPALDRLPRTRARVSLGRDPLELHSLVCARDVPMSLWSLQSFVAYSGLLPKVVIHDDGTLTDDHRQLYESRFDAIVVIDGREADARMDAVLAPWPACQRFRRLADFHCARKLFDPLFGARGDSVLLLDSDVLFFRRPDRLLQHLAGGSACFGSDYQNAYSMPHAELERWAGSSVLPRVNAGLVHIPVEPYRERLDLVERFLGHAGHASREPDVNRHEQTAHALMMSVLGAARLPARYQLGGPLDARTVSYHFVGDGKGRKAFWRTGLPRIERELDARLDRIGAAGPGAAGGAHST